jgi:hypothetical protein
MCRSREGGNPVNPGLTIPNDARDYWMPAFAGMTPSVAGLIYPVFLNPAAMPLMVR